MKRTCVCVAMAVLVFAASGCRRTPGGEFAIYLLPAETTVEQARSMDPAQAPLPDQPFLSEGDIVSYTWATHEIELAASALQRVQQLQVSVRGRVFVACVGRKPVYWGAFWTPISSVSFDGVVIRQPLGEGRVIRIERGYPGSDFSRGEDPRSNPEILQALQRAGKLAN